MRAALLLLVLTVPARAADLKSIVRGIERRYQSSHTLKAVFLERYQESRNAIRIESGTVYFARGGRMRWEYEAPEEKLFLSDGKWVWFYVGGDRTVTRTRLKESEDWHTPLALLAGKAKLSRICGRMELAEAAHAARGNSALRCLPKSKESGFAELILEVDAEWRLERLLIRDAGGVEMEFRFGNWQENLSLPKSLFRFEVPAGVAVVEESSGTGTSRE